MRMMIRPFVPLMIALGIGVGAVSTAAYAQAPSGGRQTAPTTGAVQSFTANVTGPVISIDKQRGRLTMRTIDGLLTLEFPPATLAKLEDLKPGDRVTFALGLTESAQPAASSGAGASSGQPAARPREDRATEPVGIVGTVRGEVAGVDTTAGKLALKTDDGTVNLNFPPAALAGLKQGDRVTARVALIERPR